MQMCLKSAYWQPYVNPTASEDITLTYKICVRDNAKDIQLYGVQNLLGLPSGIPDERMISKPIWSTWAQYKTQVNPLLSSVSSSSIIDSIADQ